MSNMSYCRFQNTLHDLRDCAEHLGDKLGEDEAYARKRLVLVCTEILGELCLTDEVLETTDVERAIDKALAECMAAAEDEEEDEDDDA